MVFIAQLAGDELLYYVSLGNKSLGHMLESGAIWTLKANLQEAQRIIQTELELD